MKKTTLSFFIAVLVLLSGSTTLHAQTSCTTVTDDTYAQCCPTPTPSANRSACSAYLSSKQAPTPTVQGGELSNPTVRTNAQWRDYCDGIVKVNNKQDFSDCCSYQHGVGYEASRCYDWYMFGGSSAPGTVNSGTLNTNTTFSEQPTIAGNPTITGKSNSAVLASCSAIKFKSLLDILVWVKCVITSIIIPLIFTLAFLFFLWNVIRFMNASDSRNKEEAKERMWWGIIALFVMLSVWGIIKILSNTLGIEPSVPMLQTKTYLDPASANKGK